MAVYVVGDVQGCYESLRRLLDRIGFEPGADTLWFVGDLVNRGPSSLAVLRWVQGLGSRAVVVLGNHDLHLIAIALGAAAERPGDTLADVLAAPDRDELVRWLRRRPLLHRAGGWAMVHAGLHPSWTWDIARAAAEDLERTLAGPGCRDLLRVSRSEPVERWTASADASSRRVAALAVFTRMRTCGADGRLDHRFKGPPEDTPEGLVPWFDLRSRRRHGQVIFGHWAALGHRRVNGAIALDSGCVWGGTLTAFRLDDERSFSVPCADKP